MARSDSHSLVAPLQTAIAEELRHVGTLLEQLAEALVGDADFVARHIERLQLFDLIVQCAHESAAVLDRLSAGASAHEAIGPVRLGMVRERLHIALDVAA